MPAPGPSTIPGNNLMLPGYVGNPVGVMGEVAGPGAPDPFGLGFCPTFLGQGTLSLNTFAAANNAEYYRVYGSAIITKIALHVGTASGNISLGAYRNSGIGRAAAPGVQLYSTGAIACPAAGYNEIALPTPIALNVGDWLAISCDNLTATFMLTAGQTSNLMLGMGYSSSSASHPLPTTPTALVAAYGRAVALVGLP